MQGAGEQLQTTRTQFPYAHPFPESPLVFLKLKKKILEAAQVRGYKDHRLESGLL